jgi:hypothetical protein
VFTSICAAVAYSTVATPIDLLKVKVMALNNDREKELKQSTSKTTRKSTKQLTPANIDDNKDGDDDDDDDDDDSCDKDTGYGLSRPRGMMNTCEKQATVMSQVMEVIKSEGGVLNLWRGLWPATLRLLPVVILVFPLMEKMRLLLGVGEY